MKKYILLYFLFNCLNSNSQIVIKGSYTQVGGEGDLICFGGMKVTSSNPNDSIWVFWDHAIPKASFTAKFNGTSKQEWDLCWQTINGKDGSYTPYTFTVYATNKKDTVSHVFSILVCMIAKGKRTFTYLGNDSFELSMVETRGIRDSDVVCQWTVPFPGGIKYNGLKSRVKIKRVGITVIESQIWSKQAGYISGYIDTIFFYPDNISKLETENPIEVLYINNQQLQVNSKIDKQLHASIIDFSGKVLLSNIIIPQNGNTMIDISQINNGLYILRCESGGEVYSKKFLKYIE